MATAQEIEDAIRKGDYKGIYTKPAWFGAELSISAKKVGRFYGVCPYIEKARIGRVIDNHDAVSKWLGVNYGNPIFDDCWDEKGKLDYYKVLNLTQAPGSTFSRKSA